MREVIKALALTLGVSLGFSCFYLHSTFGVLYPRLILGLVLIALAAFLLGPLLVSKFYKRMELAPFIFTAYSWTFLKWAGLLAVVIAALRFTPYWRRGRGRERGNGLRRP